MIQRPTLAWLTKARLLCTALLIGCPTAGVAQVQPAPVGAPVSPAAPRIEGKVQLENEVTALGWSPSGRSVAVADEDGVYLFSSGGWAPQATVKESDVAAILFLAEDRLITGASSGKVRVWQVPQGRILDEFDLGEDVLSLAVSPDGRVLVAGGEDGTLIAWELAVGEKRATFKHQKAVLALAFTSDDAFASIGADGQFKLWDLGRKAEVRNIVGPELNETLSAAYCTGTQTFATAGIRVITKKGYRGIEEKHLVFLRDGVVGTELARYEAHEKPIRALAFSHAGRYLASGGDGKFVRIWDTQTGSLAYTLERDSPIRKLAFSPAAPLLASAGKDGKVVFYRGGMDEPDALVPSTPTPDLTPGETFLVSVGIGDYEDPRIPDLPFASADARGVYDLMTSSLGGIRRDSGYATAILDRKATLATLREIFEKSLPQRVGSEDTLIVYIACHGVPGEDRTGRNPDGITKYLAPADVRSDAVEQTGYSMDVLGEDFRKIHAKRVVVFLDCCYAGEAVDADKPRSDVSARTFSYFKIPTRGIAMTTSFLQKFTVRDQGSGTLILTASKPEQRAIEFRDRGHGLFTYYLIAGLGGEADFAGGVRDGTVTTDEIVTYVKTMVPRHAQQLGVGQDPMDFGSSAGSIVLTRPSKQTR